MLGGHDVGATLAVDDFERPSRSTRDAGLTPDGDGRLGSVRRAIRGPRLRLGVRRHEPGDGGDVGRRRPLTPSSTRSVRRASRSSITTCPTPSAGRVHVMGESAATGSRIRRETSSLINQTVEACREPRDGSVHGVTGRPWPRGPETGSQQMALYLLAVNSTAAPSTARWRSGSRGGRRAPRPLPRPPPRARRERRAGRVRGAAGRAPRDRAGTASRAGRDDGRFQEFKEWLAGYQISRSMESGRSSRGPALGRARPGRHRDAAAHPGAPGDAGCACQRRRDGGVPADGGRRPLTEPTGVEDLLRDLAPQVLGALVRRFGDFDDAEDAVQEALLAASLHWPREGVPAARAVAATAAERRLIDAWRSEGSRRRREELVAARRRAARPPPVTTR